MLKEPITKSPSPLTTTVPVGHPRLREPGGSQTPHVSPEQHSLARSIVLHLLSGAALFAFVVVAAALGMPAILTLLAGVALVIVPLELGYLLYQGRRKTGRWSLSEVVGYREPLPARRIALWAVPLVAWFIVRALLPLPPLDAVAERRSDPRAAPLGLRNLAEAQSVAVDGRANFR